MLLPREERKARLPMNITERIREKMQAELLNIQIDWLNAKREVGRDERTYWAESPRNFKALIQKTINDPEFWNVISVTPWIKKSFKPEIANMPISQIPLTEKPIGILELSSRTLRILEDARIQTVGHLFRIACSDELKNYRGMGMTCLMDVAHALRKVGMPVEVKSKASGKDGGVIP